MDFDLFFSTPRWRILEILAKNPSSPVEISQKINTSVAYVSQQLKLLEAGNLITKKRTGSAEKGKPRTVFSLSKEVLQITLLMNKFPARKLLFLNDHHKVILRIWMLEDSELHYYIEKFYWSLEDHLEDIKAIFIDLSSAKSKVVIISDSKKIISLVDGFLKKFKGKLECGVVSDLDLKKLSGKIHPIYDPKFLLFGKELKGGFN